MKTLVNHVEFPFARSLISCEVPVDASEFSGSMWCGDRLKVIGDGYGITQYGQALENGAMLLSLTLVALISNVFGRKVALLIGLAGTTLSVALFVVASASPTYSRYLYAAGQGLQGLLPLDYLSGMIVYDVSVQSGADGPAAYQLAQYSGILTQTVFAMLLGNSVVLLELSDYQWIWLLILACNVAVLLVTLLGFQETLQQPHGEEPKAAGPVRRLLNEVLSYRGVFGDWRARRYLTMVLLSDFWKPILGLVPVQLMAYHKWSQMHLTVFFFVIQPFGLLCLPLMQKVIDRFGNRRAWKYAMCYIWSVMPVLMLSIPVCEYVPLMCFATLCTAAGFHPFKNYMDSRFCEPDQIGRFQSVQWLIGYFLAMWLNPMYGMAFDAAAASYAERALPNFIALFWMAAQVLLIVFGMYVIDGGRDGFRVLLSLLDSAAAKSTEAWLLLPKDENGHLAREQWECVGISEALGKTFEEVGGPVKTAEQWKGVTTALATSLKAIRHLDGSLEQILSKARELRAKKED